MTLVHLAFNQTGEIVLKYKKLAIVGRGGALGLFLGKGRGFPVSSILPHWYQIDEFLLSDGAIMFWPSSQLSCSSAALTEQNAFITYMNAVFSSWSEFAVKFYFIFLSVIDDLYK